MLGAPPGRGWLQSRAGGCWGGGAEVEKPRARDILGYLFFGKHSALLARCWSRPICQGMGQAACQRPLLTPLSHPQGYQWLKDKILSEEGRRQQAKLKELQAIAERLGCTLPQLAIGKGAGEGGRGGGRATLRLHALHPQPGVCGTRASAPSCWVPPTPTS